MIEFAAVLARVEASAEGVSTPPRPTPVSFYGSEAANGATACAAACAAYARDAQRTAEEADAPTSYRSGGRPAHPPDMKSLLDELATAGASIPRLASLRRKAAWFCHPDRLLNAGGAPACVGMAEFLAEFNARIDAAITAARRR